MGTVEASKYISLEKLIEIRDDHYCGQHDKSGKQLDYDPDSVDRLIWEKTEKRYQEETNVLLKRMESI